MQQCFLKYIYMMYVHVIATKQPHFYAKFFFGKKNSQIHEKATDLPRENKLIEMYIVYKNSVQYLDDNSPMSLKVLIK